MKVLQTSALPLGYVAEERRPRELARDGAATMATRARRPDSRRRMSQSLTTDES
jgi:hypothetical protein